MVSSKVKCFAICFVLAFLIIGILTYKPPLKNATQSDLDAIHGIVYGGVIADRINEYILENPKAKVEDLRVIKGVDDMIIDQLKERFR